MASLDRISPEVFRRITEVIGSKLKAVRQVSRSDGIKSLASLLNHVDPTMVDTILSQVEEENQPAATSVREMMFVFDDLLGIDKEGMKALLGKCDRKVLTTALKGTTAKIREHFTQCMSQRAAEMLMEDMDASGAGTDSRCAGRAGRWSRWFASCNSRARFPPAAAVATNMWCSVAQKLSAVSCQQI
jgi:flagellar motor switch protein FliG